MSNEKVNWERENDGKRTYVRKTPEENVSRETIYKKKNQRKEPPSEQKSNDNEKSLKIEKIDDFATEKMEQSQKKITKKSKHSVKAEDETAKKPPEDIENPKFSRLYKTFRNNGLSVHESFYNAAYLRASDNYYSSEASVRKKYENVYMHPKSWFNNRTTMWKHNKWSVVLKIMEIPSLIKRGGDGLWHGVAKIGTGVVKTFESRRSVKSNVAGLVSLTLLAGTAIFGVKLWTDWNVNVRQTPMLRLYIDGEYVGNVKSASSVEKARQDVESSVSVSLGLPYTLNCSLDLDPVRGDKSEILSDAKLNKAFHETAHNDMMTGYCLYNGDVPICAVEDKKMLEDCIAESLQRQHSDLLRDEDVQNVAYKDFVIRRGSYPDSLFVDEEGLYELLSVTESEAGKENGAKALSLDGTLIANSSSFAAGVSVDTYNSGGDEAEGVFSVSLETVVRKNETVSEVLPYGTDCIYDENYPEGYSSVVSYGKNGRRNATYSVEYTGGKETDRRLLDEEVVSEAVNEVKRIGTRPLTEEEKMYKSTGSYIFPAKGSLSDGYGWRVINGGNEFHKGLDIRSNGGLEVIAADGGEIIQAADIGNGYGLCVLIQHDDGTLTRYAHCDELYVAEGQKVKQGQSLGKMGSTGYVTGVHLHFEIIKNGSAVDPMDYLVK